MAEIQMQMVSEFKGESVVLFAMDQAGLVALRDALLLAHGGFFSTATADGVIVEIRQEPIEAQVELAPSHAVLRVSEQKIKEIVEKLDAMYVTPFPCHQYVEIGAPERTLVLAKDEYLVGVN